MLLPTGGATVEIADVKVRGDRVEIIYGQLTIISFVNVLELPINSAYIIIEPFLKDDTMEIPRLLYASFIGIHLPGLISPAGMSHSSLFIPLTEKYGLLIEFGRSRDSDDVFRLALMKNEDMDRALTYSVHAKSFLCHAKNRMTIGDLLRNTKYSTNDRDFAVNAVRLLKLYRPGLQNHTLSKVCIPHSILKELEKHESDAKNVISRGIQKIPIFGPVIGAIIS